MTCFVCEKDLIQEREWRSIRVADTDLKFDVCIPCTNEILDKLAAQGIALEALHPESGVWQAVYNNRNEGDKP